MKILRSLLLVLLLLLPGTYASAGSSQLDLSQNGMYAATDGEETFFFLRDGAGRWMIQNASNQYLGKPALYQLPEGESPFAMLYADADTLWFACYNAALQYEDEGNTWSAATVYRVNRESSTMEVMLSDADARSIYPSDGGGLYYVPWNNPGMLAKIDFLTGHDQPLLSLENETIWSVTQSSAGLFLLALDEDGGEVLYRAGENGAEKLPLPSLNATEYWLQGDYCLARTADGSTLYCLSLAAPEQATILPEALRGTILYRYGNILLGIRENENGLATVYYVNLENNEIIKSAYFESPPYYFVLGYGGEALHLLDGMGRLLQISNGFETLRQVAQVDMAALYEESAWVYALALDDYILLLGYGHEDAFQQPGDRQPPSLAKIIPLESGMHDDATEDAVG